MTDKTKTYKAIVDQTEFTFNQSDLENASLQQTQEKNYHFRYKNKNFQIAIKHFDKNRKEFKLLLNNQEYKIQLKDKLDDLIEHLGLNALASQKIENIKSPMPGLILDVLVKPGDEIEKGSKLLVLEAMKMENILMAEGEGIVKSIEIEKGATVDKGAILIEME